MSNNITGTFTIPSTVAAFKAPCIALVRDITNSDSPDIHPVAIENWELSYTPGTPTAFTITGIPDAALADADAGIKALNLEVHVDLDRSGAFSTDDLATLKPHPVTRATTEASIAVELQLI